MTLNGLPIAVAEKVNEIVNLIEKGRLAIFCGSGISVKEPSNLPTGRQLLNKILDTLVEDQIITNDAREKIVKMQFEAFIETIEKNVAMDENTSLLNTLVKLFAMGKPNKNHILIAYLFAQGHLNEVMTTNFDTKIEDAICILTKKGLIPKKIKLETFFREEQFNRILSEWSDSPTLFKVHGSIKDPSSIRATLDYVSSTVLVEARTRVVRRFFGEVSHDILVLGYSGSDYFDINQVINRIETNNRIIKITRPRREPPAVLGLEEPFSNFEGYTLRVSFDALIEYLYNKFVGSSLELGEAGDHWQQHVNDWGKSIPDCYKLSALAMIYYKLGEFDKAKELYRQAQTIFKRLGNQSGVAITFHQLAIIHQRRGEFDEAREFYEQARANFEGLDNQSKIASILGQLAIIHQDRGEFEEAMELYNQAKIIFERLGDQSGVARVFHQLAIIYQRRGEYDEAMKLYNKSLKIEEWLGDQSGVATTLHQLAMIHQWCEEFGEARELYHKSLEIRERLGDQSGVADVLHQLAMIHQDKGEYDEARELYHESIEIDEWLGDQSGVATSLHQLANIHYMQGEFEEAMELYNQAKIIFERLGDQSAVANTIGQMGMIHQDRGEYNKARELYEQARTVFERLEDKRAIAIALFNLGILSLLEGKKSEAKEYFIRANRIFKLIKHNEYIRETNQLIREIRDFE